MDPSEGQPSNLPDSNTPLAEDTFRPTTTVPPPPDDASSAHVEPPQRLTRPSLFELGAEMRRSILELPIFKPRWKPWSPARVASVTLAFGAVMALLVVLTHKAVKRWTAPAQTPVAAVLADEPIVTPAAAIVGPRADASLARERRSPLSGGLFTLPPQFHSADGAYDLVIHFHGNTELVEESFALSGINAAVVIMNLGIGSGPYEDRFANPLSLPDVLTRAQATMEKRGLANAHLRRLALSAWSAGYGAVLKVLDQPALAEKVDAVLLLDGIHCGYQPHSKDLILERLAPFVRFAREAVEGKRLFVITHSNIDPMSTYAGTHETTDALLRALDLSRSPGGDAVEVPPLRSIDGVIAKKKVVPLVPESFVIREGLHVKGYAGNLPEDHMAHLIHMVRTALPELAERWKE